MKPEVGCYSSLISGNETSLPIMPPFGDHLTKVDVYNVKIGMKVIPAFDWIYGEQNDKAVGEIVYKGAGYYGGEKIHTHQCVVKWRDVVNAYRIGYENCFDLAIADESIINKSFKKQKNGTGNDKNREKEKNSKSIKVHRFAKTVRQGNRIRGFAVPKRTGSNKCVSGNI